MAQNDRVDFYFTKHQMELGNEWVQKEGAAFRKG